MASSKVRNSGAALFVAAVLGGAGVAIALVLSGDAAAIDDKTVFCSEYVPNAQTESAHQKWLNQNPGERTRWEGFRDAICAGGNPAPPTMLTARGRALAAAGKMALPEEPPPPTTTTTTTMEPPPTVLGVNPATMQSGGTILREDSAAVANPEPGLWGSIECVADSRHAHKTTGGDPRPKANGAAQGNSAYRELTVLNGDDFYGERCQIGRNEWRYGENTGTQTSGTFALGLEGQRRVTFWSMRFPTSYPMSTGAWQQVVQWKQTQPYTGSLTATRNPDGNGVTTEIQLWSNLLRLHSWWRSRWTTAVPVKNVWIRFAWDITFSQYTNIGKMQLYADLNGDGDFLEANEMSPVWNGATLLYASSAHSGLAAGQSIPSFLGLGTYHDTAAYGTTVVDVDNVQVVG